jgi:plastocyanin
MHKRTIATAFAALAVVVATAVLAVPASAFTFQVNVTMNDGSCSPALLSVATPNTAIVFHLINNGTVAHGLTIWGDKSMMIPANQSGNIEVNFFRPGTYRFACTTGAVQHPTVYGKGVFQITS